MFAAAIPAGHRVAAPVARTLTSCHCLPVSRGGRFGRPPGGPGSAGRRLHPPQRTLRSRRPGCPGRGPAPAEAPRRRRPQADRLLACPDHSRTLPADSKPFAMSRSGGGGGGFQLFLFLRVTETVTRRPVVALSPALWPWPPEDATEPSLLRARHGAWRWQPSLCCGPGPSGAAGGGGRINIE